MTATLEHDLVNSQVKIITLLKEYQKSSQQIIKSSYTTELYSILDSIASFDHQKIKQCQSIIKDKTALQFLDNIADKIKSAQQQKVKQNVVDSSTNNRPKKIQTEAKIQQKQQKSKKQGGGIFEFVRKRLGSKQKKATEMILPDDEPKCYYDPVTKTYVFEGQEPQVPKQIQRPPSAAEKKAKQDIKKEKDDSQLGQLTAPPAFRRKSTPGGKGKTKIKEQIQVVKPIEEPLTFSRVIQEINMTYNQLLEKLKIGTYQRHSQISTNNSDIFSEFTSFIEKTIQSSEQINVYENKKIEKWTKILTSESRQLKIMEKVLKQISESANIYSTLLKKIEHTTIQQNSKREFTEKMVNYEIARIDEQIQTQSIQEDETTSSIGKQAVQSQSQKQQLLYLSDLSSQLRAENQLLKRQNESLKEINTQTEQRQEYQYKTMILTLNQQIIEINNEKNILTERNNKYKQELLKIQQAIVQKQSQHFGQITHLTNSLNSQINEKTNKIIELQNQKVQLYHHKSELQQKLKKQRIENSQTNDYLHIQIIRQKIKIQEQLKFTQQKERNYLKILKDMQQHENQIQEYDTFDQQHELLRTVLNKRLQGNRNPEIQSLSASKIQLNSTTIVSQLSDIIGIVTETNLDRLEQFSKSYSKLLQKYIESKTLLKKIKSNSMNQSMCLNRSITKQKALLEIYKIGKHEVQEKCSQLQLQCDRLKKKLDHYKQQDHFNKSYLTRLKPSKIINQDESFLSLHEEKQQLTTEIDDLQKEIQVKNQTLQKNQIDLEDLLIKYEKNQQKLLQVEKKYKQNEKQAKHYKQSRQKLENKIKLLELKLQNQKQRYDEIQNQESSRLKSMELSFEKKLKLLKGELDQSYQREEQLKLQHEQITKSFKTRIVLLQESHHKIENQLRDAIKLKSNQNDDLLAIIQDVNQRIQLQREEKIGLNERNLHLMQTQTQLNRKLNDIINEHLKEIQIHRESQQSMNNIITKLLQQYNSFKIEQQQFKQQYQSKLYHLHHELESSQLQSNDLLIQLSQYSKHITHLNSAIQDISKCHLQEKQINQNALKQALSIIQILKSQIQSLKSQKGEKTIQNKEFEELIEKMSQEMARFVSDRQSLSRDKTDLQQKLIFKDRQIETLNNQINKKSEELMIKTQQLSQMEQVMLEHQQLSVTKKQELDELKNQLENSKKQIVESKQLILSLKSDIQKVDKQKYEIIEQQKQSINAKNSEIYELNQAVLKLQEFISAKNEEKNNQSQNLSFYKVQLLNKNSQIKQNEENIHMLNSQIKRLQEEKEKDVIDISSLKDVIQVMANKSEILENQNYTLKNQLQVTEVKKNDLVRKVSQMQSQLSQNHEKLLVQKSKSESKQIAQNDEIQNEMEYLLKEIQRRENQIQVLKSQLRNKEIALKETNNQKQQLQIVLQNMNESIEQKSKQTAQLRNAVNNLQQIIQNEKEQKLKLISQIKRLAQSNRFLQLDLLSLSGKKHELEVTKRQQLYQIGQLSQQLSRQHEVLIRKEKLTECLAKEQNSLIQELIQDLHIKDEVIIEKQQQLEGQQKLVQQYVNERIIKQDELRKVNEMLDEKNKIVGQMKLSVQQKNRLIAQKQRIVAQKENEIAQLKNNLIELSQIIDKQQNLLENYKNLSRSQLENSELQKQFNINQQIRVRLQEKDEEKHELLIKINQLKQKQIECMAKIAILQQQASKAQDQPIDQDLQEKYKALLDENTVIMNEKVQLMKSNNYLVSINQKLVGEKSSYNMRQIHKAQSHINPPAVTKAPELKQRPTSDITEVKTETKGFFGALSSLFLTPTQADRLRK